ncbi:uncharacterized protein SPPG_05801 [Spizellomyces punctatus DAOM BR117]|uniref:G-protein coupled receptors family 1 profile domain-containing protein n=1 Tax=Spizellomyces punctatus (strain DAOM BR117) TaxID=645134 RepID=A0A0L0HCZ9_SPIPD|nr:uncharacterized protein SPPG_05801 [Spizellomyces punctatus DAOM BR117]KNC98824.1 hypothetical protein SPPG_05801 [Spizellomyces punctatus DAOM BR117]|eukprot:XP_016606864.1 hypothetical protein SPPG_05801 [Spizellomyces punctatus DAOM BR117]
MSSSDDDAARQFYLDNYLLVNLSFLVLAPIHLIVISLVFYRSYVLVFKEKKALSLSQRIPVYIVIGEFLMLTSFGTTALYQIIKQRLFTGTTCRAMGAFTGYFAAVEYLLSSFLSAFTYARVCRQWEVSWGKYDWGLLIPANGICLTLLVICWETNWFGPLGEFSCFIDTTQGEHSRNIAIAAVTLLLCSIASVVAFSTPVLVKIWRTSRDLERVLAITVQGGKLVFAHSDVNKAASKITVYVLVYSVKWISGVPLYTPLLGQGPARVPPIYYVFPYIFFHIGGIINGIVYLLYEDFIPEFIARPLARRRARRQLQQTMAAGWDVGDMLGVMTGLEERRDEYVSVSVPVWNGTSGMKGRTSGASQGNANIPCTLAGVSRSWSAPAYIDPEADEKFDTRDERIDLKTMLIEEQDEQIDLITMLAGERQELEDWEAENASQVPLKDPTDELTLLTQEASPTDEVEGQTSNSADTSKKN